jgi:D-alanine-D-alanine ligase
MKNLTVMVLEDCGNLTAKGQLKDHHDDGDLVHALRRLSKRMVLVGYDGVAALSATIAREKPDVVFNLTEWIDGDRMKDVHIAALLDLHGVPYTGPGPKGLMLCRDKAISKLVAERAGFAVPRTFDVDGARTASPYPFPLVVKPRFGDASEGISQAALVRSNEELRRRAAMLRRTGVDAVLAEEYAAGREILVTMLGERIVTVCELIIGRVDGARTPRLFSSRIKHDLAHRRRWAIKMEMASLTPEERRRLDQLSRRTAAALELRDYGRIDVKLAPSGEMFFLEANPNPALIPGERSFSGAWTGIDFDELVTEITMRAWHRRGASGSRETG